VHVTWYFAYVKVIQKIDNAANHNCVGIQVADAECLEESKR